MAYELKMNVLDLNSLRQIQNKLYIQRGEKIDQFHNLCKILGRLDYPTADRMEFKIYEND